MTEERRQRDRSKHAKQHWRDRPVEQEGDKDIKEGGMEQQQKKPEPAREERG